MTPIEGTDHKRRRLSPVLSPGIPWCCWLIYSQPGWVARVDVRFTALDPFVLQ